MSAVLVIFALYQACVNTPGSRSITGPCFVVNWNGNTRFYIEAARAASSTPIV